MAVHGRLREINQPVPDQNLEQGFMVQIGNSSFYITHFRDGAQIQHTQQEWNAMVAGRISDFVQNLQEQNAGFNPNQISELDIDLSGRISYKTLSNPNAAIDIPRNRVDQAFLREFIRVLGESAGVPVDRNTISGSFHQASSPLAENAPNACTAIDLEFAMQAVQYSDGSFITQAVIDKSILRGQTKYATMLPRIQREMQEAGPAMQGEDVLIDFTALDLNTYYPLLERAAMKTVVLTEDTAADFTEMLMDLSTAAPIPAIFGGITNGRGDSYGIIFYKDNQHRVTEVVYFDSHSRDANGAPNACAKRFGTIQEAADFLARRNPYIAEGQNPHRNDIAITPFCFHYNLKEFFEAQDPAMALAAYNKLQAENPLFARTIAALCGEGNTTEARVQDGLQKITNNPAALAPITKERLLNVLAQIEEHRWPINT